MNLFFRKVFHLAVHQIYLADFYRKQIFLAP